MLFKDVVSDSSKLMGVKAVYDRSFVSLIAFNGLEASKKGFKVAEVALEMPYLISIGGGTQVPGQLKGRVLELMKVTGVYGKTKDFIPDEATRVRMQQWPIATVLSEVYTISDEPHLVGDLGFPDRRILERAYDGVRRDDEAINNLWKALSDRPIIRRHDIAPPPGFIDRGKLVQVGLMYPRVDPKSSEGERIIKTMVAIERDRSLSKAKKEANRSANGGIIVCEGCGLSDESGAMFDVHHLYPIHAGQRETSPADLAVLCPTCHRWSHTKGFDKLNPLSVSEVAAQRKVHGAATSF